MIQGFTQTLVWQSKGQTETALGHAKETKSTRGGPNKGGIEGIYNFMENAGLPHDF